jgi:hypothetical protein
MCKFVCLSTCLFVHFLFLYLSVSPLSIFLSVCFSICLLCSVCLMGHQDRISILYLRQFVFPDLRFPSLIKFDLISELPTISKTSSKEAMLFGRCCQIQRLLGNSFIHSLIHPFIYPFIN